MNYCNSQLFFKGICYEFLFFKKSRIETGKEKEDILIDNVQTAEASLEMSFQPDDHKLP